MIGKLMYRLIKPFFIKYYFLDQTKKSGFEKMVKVFVDSEGKAYYTTTNDFDTQLDRVRGIERCVLEIQAGLSNDEQKKIREAMKKALGDGKKPNIAMVGHLLIEWERREEMVLHPDSMFDLLAYKYVREDEDPAVVDKRIHALKIEQFKKDSKDGLYDFFYKMGLSAYIPYLTKSESEWNAYYRESEAKIRAMGIHLNEYLYEQS
jgi:hypothetical protein